ncbi:MAG TPA: hypothetical protein VK929_08400 [Longimicrobiales bacterium]|nr:hypothetical protein [Longimicrobiales bacterium]
MVLLTTSCSPDPDVVVAKGGTLMTECPAQLTSRWISDAGFILTAEYGRRAGEELGNYVRQMAAAGDSVLYVYDIESSRIVILTAELNYVSDFGRRGSGPGELAWQSITGGQQIGVVGEHVAVHDLRAVQLFGSDGSFVAFHPAVAANMSLLSREIVAFAGGEDSLRLIRRQARPDTVYSLEYLVATVDSLTQHAMLHGAQVPVTPQGWRVWTGLPRQARPIGTLHGACAYMQDGGAGPLVRHNAVTGLRDSIYLPTMDVPSVSPAERAHVRAGAQRFNVDMGNLVPTELTRWIDIKVDPDGHIWLRAWMPSWDEVAAVVISPSTGEHITVALPGFPIAFGPPGSFFTVLTDQVTAIRYLARVEAVPPESYEVRQ